MVAENFKMLLVNHQSYKSTREDVRNRYSDSKKFPFLPEEGKFFFKDLLSQAFIQGTVIYKNDFLFKIFQ